MNQPAKTNKQSQERLWSLSFVLVVIISFLGNVNGNGVHNGCALLVNAENGPAYLSGFIIAAFSFTALAARFVAGSMSDKHGRKIVMAVGFVSIMIGCLIAIFTTDLFALIPSRIFMGFGFSMVVTSSAAAVADIVPISRLGEGMGYQGLAFAVAMAGGPALAIYLAEQGRFPLFACMGIFAIIGFAFVLMLKLEKKPSLPRHPSKTEQPLPDSSDSNHTSAAENSKNTKATVPGSNERGLFKYVERAAVRPAFIAMMAYIPMGIYLSYMSLYAVDQNIEGIAWFFVAAVIFMLGIRALAGKAFDRCPVNLLLIPSIVVGMAGFAVPLIFNNTPALIFSGACYGIFCGVVQPLLTTESLRRAPEGRNGAASAMFYIGLDIGVGGGSIMWGFIIATFGFATTFMVGIAILVVTIICSLLFLKPTK